MGISSGAQTLYHLEGLSIADVAAGMRGLYNDRKTQEELSMDMPTIDGDSNNILKVVGGASNTKSAAVAMYFSKWKETGITVHPMVDGKTRPNAKKASCDRRANRHRDYIKSYTTLKEANKMKRELASGTFSAEDIVQMNKDIKKLEEKSTKQLARSQQSWPADFAEALEEELVNGVSLRSADKTGGCIGAVFEASYEADYAIIGRFLDKKIIAAITSDSDIAVLAGDGLPCIKKFTETKDNSGKTGMTIVSTCKSTILNIKQHLPEESKAVLKDAKCPIFEGVKSRKLRALMMVAVGCDVYPSGISGVGPATLKKQYLDKLKKKMPECDRTDETKLYNALLGMVVKESKLDANTIDTFVKGLLYQPTNYKSLEETSTADEIVPPAEPGPYTYMEDPPDVLPSYLFDDFAQVGVTTLDKGGPEVLSCVGAEGHSHVFLSQIGSKHCHGCNGVICKKCTEDVNNKPFCLPCAAGELLIPSQDEGYMERINFMRNELKHRYQWDNADDMAVDQVERSYDAAIKDYQGKMGMMDQVKFPLYRTSELKQPTKWKHVADIHFCNGGTFIAEPLLSEHVPALLELFASSVKYQATETDVKWMKASGIYDALPELIINFAKNSRVESGEATGFRLLQRCVRHGHDPKMPSLFYNKASIIQLEQGGSLGLVIKTKVPASMQAAIYNTTTAHTATDLLAVECECKSGSTNEENVTCVHNPPVLYGVTKLMYEGLAQHILIELTSCIDPLLSTWSNETKASVKESVIVLMQAAGEYVNDNDRATMTIDALLERFLMGTEKTKLWGQAVSKFGQLTKPGPICEMCFDSPTKKAKSMKNKSTKEVETNVDSNSSSIDCADEGDGVPNYVHATSLIKAAGIDLSSFDPVGMQLLRLRAERENVSQDEVIDTYKRMSKVWEQLRSESTVRKRRPNASQQKNLSVKRKATSISPSDGIPAASHVTPAPTAKTARVQPTRQVKSPQVTTEKKTRGRPRIHHDGKPKPNRKKPKAHKYCAKEGCAVNDATHPGMTFHRIPAIPPEISLDKSKKQQIKQAMKLLLREEIVDRCGFKRDLLPGTSYRICAKHPTEYVTKPASFIHTTPGDDDWVLVHQHTQSYKLLVPKAEGAKSTENLETTRKSTGLPSDRLKRKQLEDLNKQRKQKAITPNDKRSESSEEDNLRADAAESRLEIQLMAEHNSPSRHTSSSAGRVLINESVAKEAGLKLDFNESPVKTPHGEKFFYSEPITPKSNEKKKGEKINFVALGNPVVNLGTSSDDMQHRTGFQSEAHFLAFIFLICEGNGDLIRRRSTPLTWYEEWFFFAEWIYGRSFTTLWNAKQTYGPEEKYLRSVFRQKLALVKRARRQWGYFVTHDEDIRLRKEKWNIKYRERDGVKTRVIMWDMTGIKSYRFGAAELQRDTYSKYYAGNCFKGGIGLQLCSWGLTWPLWGGHESDSRYHETAGYLEAQQEFQKKDMLQSQNGLEVVPFTNVLDKGYRSRAVNWRHGEQLTAQPIFGKSDQHFTGAETKYSASLASDRGANERGVNVSKRSGIIKRGFKPRMDPKMFDDVWLCWGFMANFMYKQVL